MGLRETINQNQKVAIGLISVVVLGSLAFAVLYTSQGMGDPLAGGGKAFYTVDDGKSFFSADSMLIAPFMHEGQPAVQALVYTSDGGKTRFVGYLMRFTPAGQEKLRAMREAVKSNRGAMPGLDPELQANTEVKKPGSGDWVKLSNISAAAEVMNVRAPGDPTRLADPVDP